MHKSTVLSFTLERNSSDTPTHIEPQTEGGFSLTSLVFQKVHMSSIDIANLSFCLSSFRSGPYRLASCQRYLVGTSVYNIIGQRDYFNDDSKYSNWRNSWAWRVDDRFFIGWMDWWASTRSDWRQCCHRVLWAPARSHHERSWTGNSHSF